MKSTRLITLIMFCLTIMMNVEAKEWQLQWPTYSNELKKQATLDNEKAYVDLAICYGYGLGVKQDVKKCNNMLGALGFRYRHPYGGRQEATIYPYAAFWYGVFLCDHTGEYTAKQLKWLDWSDRAEKYLPAESESIRWSGLRWIFMAAEDGHLYDALIFAARTERNYHEKERYNRDTMRGKGYNENARYASAFGYYQLAMQLYQKACETGSLDAMEEYCSYLIDMVEKSRGQFEDNQNELAVYWIKTAAENGSPQAQWIYGNMYRLGWQYRVPNDMNKAIEWYMKSADNGYARAMGDAGKYILASSAPDKETRALKYLQMGIENNDGGAACELGKYYKSKNPEKAFEYFLKSGEFNHPEGLYELGQCYHNGLGTSIDLKAAAQVYELCASREDIMDRYIGLCARKLSEMYETGQGVFMNKNKAAHYRWIAEQYKL